MRYLISIIIIGLIAVTSPADADMITLKGGLIFKGKVLETTKEEIKMETFKGEVTIPRKLISRQSRSKTPYELYQTELEKLKDKESDAEEQYKMGIWCKGKKIWHKAKYHLEEALKIDKEHEKAQKALEDVEKNWLKQCERIWHGFTLNIGVVPDMTKEEMEKLSEMIKTCSKELARSTGGMLYFKEVIFTDKTRAGNMLYNPAGATGNPGVPGSHNNFEHGPANWHPVCILHEFGHFTLMLADEYDTSIYGVAPSTNVFCQNCKMEFPQPLGQDWCSSLNHPAGAGNTPGCQEILISRYKKCTLLAEAFNYAEDEILYPPEPKIIINDK